MGRMNKDKRNGVQMKVSLGEWTKLLGMDEHIG